MFTVRFGSVFIKKSNQTEFFFFKKKPKPNRNRFKPTGFGSVRFLRAKTGLARFFRFGSVLARFGSVFYPVFFGSVRFGFSGSRLKKPKPNRTGRFFQNFNRFIRFFSRFGFFGYFFSGLIGFSVFLNTPSINWYMISTYSSIIFVLITCLSWVIFLHIYRFKFVCNLGFYWKLFYI